nr:MAG TPA: Minor tail protein T [Caudoviricetes sp.]
MRIARELHRPISEVLEYPTTEFNYWSVVFQEEYYETHPHERYIAGMTECDCAEEIEKFRELMK